MNLQSQCCSLVQAKKLNELGIIQGCSLFFFDGWSKDYRIQFNSSHKDGHYKDAKSCFSAFSVAELGIMIPSEYYLPTNKGEDGWWVSNIRQPYFQKLANTEAEARAEVLIFLLENKVVDIEEVNKRLQND